MTAHISDLFYFILGETIDESELFDENKRQNVSVASGESVRHITQITTYYM